MQASSTDYGKVAKPKAGKDSENELAEVLHDPESRNYQELRDRAAYVYCTGIYPTHLRQLMMGFLRIATRTQVQPVALDGRSGSIAVTPEVAKALDLDSHAMVSRARDYVEEGYKLFFNHKATDRRPYSKVLLYKKSGKNIHRIVVQADGSVLEGWPEGVGL
jgi:hypothetical protein